MNKFKVVLASTAIAAAILSACSNDPISFVTDNHRITDASLQPDLDVIRVNYITNENGIVRYAITIKNIGTADITNLNEVVLQNIFSENRTVGDADDKAGGGSKLGWVNPVLNAGQSVTVNFYFSESLWWPSKKYLIIVIDHNNIIAESNEDNNNIIAPLLPDVKISEMEITSESESQNVSINLTVYNDGWQMIRYADSAIYVRIAGSQNSTFGDSDDSDVIEVTTNTQEYLFPKSSYTITINFSRPASMYKYLVAKVDSKELVLESKELNNTNYVLFN